MSREWTIPEALGDEDGESWFIYGHVSPEMALLSVAVTETLNYADGISEVLVGGDFSGTTPREWSVSDQRGYADELLANVQQTWLRDDPDNPDYMKRCAEGDDGATAFTIVGAAAYSTEGCAQ